MWEKAAMYNRALTDHASCIYITSIIKQHYSLMTTNHDNKYRFSQQVAAKKTDKKGGSGGQVTKRSTFFRDRKLVRSTLKGLLNRS